MKKIFVTVTLFVAMATVANAASRQQDNLVADKQTEVINAQTTAKPEHDVYREYALQSEENEKHILRYICQ